MNLPRNENRPLLAAGLALIAALAAPPGPGLPAAEPAAKEGRPDIYDPKADAKADIAKALAEAKRGNRRVLVMFGGNWCGWCHKLHDLFRSDRSIAAILLADYRLVLVDSNSNAALAASFGADLGKHGVPFLTVLAPDGKVLVNQDTGSLEDGPRHDPDKVKAFLKKWAPEPRDAEKVLKDAVARAGEEKKVVLLCLGAPG
jgi:thiol:disulfide interchange protein